MNSKVGLVTVLFKSDEVLEGFIKSVCIQKNVEYIVYIIDNDPTEKTTCLLNDLITRYVIKQFVHIKNNTNVGLAEGNNMGIKMAIDDKCSHILLSNNDVEFYDNSLLESMLIISEKHKESIIIPKILDFKNKKIWMAGGYINKYKALGVHYGINKKDNEKFNKQKHVTYAPACFILIKADVFKSVGIMDSKYFAYYDDLDWIYRAIKISFKILYVPKFTVFHKISSCSGGDNSLFYIYYSNRNKIYFIKKKHFHSLHKIFCIAYTLYLDLFFIILSSTNNKKKPY